MKTVIEIVVLVVCAIGAASILSWVFKQTAKLLKPYAPGTMLRVGRSEEDLDKKLTKWEDLPHYKGRTWLGGLPVLADVICPDKHDYSTVSYMDHWFKQYIYDVMTSFAGGLDAKGIAYHLVIPVALIMAGFSAVNVLTITGLIFAWLYLWFSPSATRAARRSAERSKNLKPNDWRKIYQEVAESKEREDELVRALRRSGIRRL